MRRKIKFRKATYCVGIQTVAKDDAYFRYKGRSSEFLVLKEKFDELINGETKTIMDKDISNYIRVNKNTFDNSLEFEITWLSEDGRNNVRGKIERFEIDINDFNNFYNSDEEDFVTLNKPKKKRKTITEFQCNEKVKSVILNPALKRGFIKQLMRLQEWGFDSLVVYGDYMDYSFYWEGYIDNKRNMNGGVIFHKDNAEPENLYKGRYQIHT